MSFITDNQLFCMEPFGFRPGHSTELAALRLVEHLTNEMDNFNVPINIYIDLSKAFDNLNHSILLNKLGHYGISGCSYELFRSYLSNRLQFVDFNGKMFSELASSQTIANIPLALMKQFNLFPVARGIVAIIHSQYIL